MAGRVRTWVWVVLGIFVVGVLGMIAVAGLGFYFFTQHIDTRIASPVRASQDFDKVRTRFQGEKPLIELDDQGHFRKANTNRQAPITSKPLEAVHVMAFDPDDGRVVEVSIPIWLLRLKMNGATIDLNGNRMDLEDLRLTVEDLERFGPTLIVDHKSPDGSRVLVWSQ